MKLLLFIIFCATFFTSCLSAKILGIVIMPSKSHEILVLRLLRELAKRGHEITMITPFPEDKPTANLTIVTVDETLKFYEGVNMLKRKNTSPLENIKFLNNLGLHYSEVTLNNKKVKNLLHEKFDLILTEAFLGDGVYGGFSWINRAPLVTFATLAPPYWAQYMVGNVAPYSYISDPLLAYSTKMSYKERLINTLLSLLEEAYHRFFFIPRQDALMRRYFGDDLPDLNDIIRNVSLVLVNHHFSLSYSRPYVTNMVQVGGLHVDPPKPLPQNLQRFMDEATDGVVLFSLGSNIRGSMMPPEKIQAILDAFSKLKQKVLWKIDSEDLPLPSNVNVSKWLPQSDLLAHPNLKVFITHGGLLSTIEAVHRGVPVIGIPIFGDQPLNMIETVNAGFGIKLEYDDLTSDGIIEAVNEVLNNPKYRKNVQSRSQLLRDQILPPLEKAVFWVEYVIRHKGAQHLKSAAQDLKWHELVLLDVAIFFIFIVISLFLIAYFSFKLIFRLCLFKKKNFKKAEKKKKLQ